MATRTIKFRGWFNGQMLRVDDDFAITLDGSKIIERDADFEDRKTGDAGWGYEGQRGWPFIERVKLMQFTGLTDKNGKEIYEGDILSSEYPVDGNKNCHPVVWRQSRGCWAVDHSINDCCKAWRGDLGGHHASEEIIGNIYENPELLTK